MADLLTKCSVCQALLDEEDLFCSNCGTENAGLAASQGQKPQAAASAVTQAFQCAGCGASMSYSAQEGRLACPFCASTELVEKKDSRSLAPSRVVPMVLDHDAAVQGLRAWLGRGFWRPGDLSQQASIELMKPVYVPYWVFAGQTHTYWTADTSQTPSGARGDWFPLAGQHEGQYDGVLVGASAALTPAEMLQICPFDLSPAVPPDQIDFRRAAQEQFAVPRKYARPLARQRLEDLEREACDVAYIPGNSRHVKVNVKVEGMTSEPVLLPAWIMAYRYKDEVYRFLVNGQNGRATGNAPLSWFKISAAIGIAALIVILVLLLMAGR
jgi:predicted RNA-binding Zn-ribbon protein involved in translation (DUF1610 family)